MKIDIDLTSLIINLFSKFELRIFFYLFVLVFFMLFLIHVVNFFKGEHSKFLWFEILKKKQMIVVFPKRKHKNINIY